MKNQIKIIVTLIILFLLILLSLSMGETNYNVFETIKAVFGFGNQSIKGVVQTIRLPRIIVAICVGMTLSISGLFTQISLDNPLADSGILGIQSGATTFGLLTILVFPSLIYFLPLFSFIGGIIAFALVVFVAYNGKITAIRVILAGVAINAFFLALTAIISVYHAQDLQFSLSFLNGSIANVSIKDMNIIFLYTIMLVIGAFFLIPILNLLKIDDMMITSLGKNPNNLRLLIAIYAVLCASISVAFVGIISFIGIISPQISKIIVGHETKYLLIETLLVGAIIILGADTFQRIVFAPMEIPVGSIIGLIGCPVFIYLMKKEKTI